MVKENKAKEEVKEQKCDCGPDCKCGCQEGKECTCGEKGCSCHHGGCGCGGCCPCKRVLGKVIFFALVFFAGMGVNQFMNDTCLGRCPARRGMSPAQIINAQNMGNLPFYKDGNGNTIVIVNTGEEASHGCKCGADCKCGCHKDGKKCGCHNEGKDNRSEGCHKHGKHHPMKGMPEQPENPQPAE
ncbi:MAG: hypothetical protein IJ532_02390 [Alphaproteobacteria bacterium]|nr:hypothetical protein [Alphaproteobacteria bacterium]